MKNIALLGQASNGTYTRARAFISQNPEYAFTYVDCTEWNKTEDERAEYLRFLLGPDAPQQNIEISELKPNSFDLVLPLNDKFFKHVITYYGSDSPNFVNKQILNSVFPAVGIDKIAESGFNDDQFVFIKPAVGAGQYVPSYDTLNYKKHLFRNVKNKIKDLSNITIQEYFDNPVVTSVTYVSNGTSAHFVDVTEAYHLFDRNGRSLNTHVESMFHKSEKYQRYISAGLALLTKFKIEKIPGIYMLQFLTNANDKIYLNDFNTRTGPAPDMMTDLRFLIGRIHKMIPFIIGDVPFSAVDIPPTRYRCYLEDAGKILSPNVSNPQFATRLQISENKKSGLIRNDYSTFVEKL